MNTILKTELRKHFKVVNGRSAFIDKEMEKYELDIKSSDIENPINAKLHLKAKECMDNAKFDFKKGRNTAGDKIEFIDNRIEVRVYKHKRFDEVDFLGNYGYDRIQQLLPTGFTKVITDVNELIQEIRDIQTDFVKKIKCNFEVEFINGNKIKKDTVNSIEIDGDDYTINLEEEIYADNEVREELLTYDNLFKVMLDLLKQRKEVCDKIQIRKNKIVKKINKLIDEDFDKIMVRERLLE